MSSNGQPEPKLLSNSWFSSANAIGWSSDHVTRHSYQAVDWVLIVHKGVTRSGNPITWSHVMTASIMLDISVIWEAIVLLFSGSSSIWDARHFATRAKVNNCPQMPEKDKKERKWTKNEPPFVVCWRIPRMVDESNTLQKELDPLR